jgi:5-methylcytosine-specific restriction endonuclease McrA
VALLNIPPPNTTAVRASLAARIIRRDAGRCVYCGRKPAALEIDHVTPCAHFPVDATASLVNDPANLVTTCAGCNGAKGPQDLAGFARMLRGRGVPPEDVDAALRRVRAAIRRRLPCTDYL